MKHLDQEIGCAYYQVGEQLEFLINEAVIWTMTRPVATKFVQALRIFRLTFHVVKGLVLAGLIFPFASNKHKNELIRDWSKRLLDIFNVELSINGKPNAGTEQSVLIVANHISWLDIFLINAICPARFVAKSDIRLWPVFGWLCSKAGTLYIDRSRRHDAGRITQDIKHALLSGHHVSVFPEGTTSDGRELRPFHASLLQAALLANVKVHPIAIRFHTQDYLPNTALAYDGDTTLLQSLRNVITQPIIYAHLTFIEPISCVGKNRRQLKQIAEGAIASALGLPDPGIEPGISSDLPDESR